MIERFSLGKHEYIALCDLLKLTGVANTGGHAKLLIAAGEVTRNGEIETRKTAKIHVGEVIGLGDVEIHVEA